MRQKLRSLVQGILTTLIKKMRLLFEYSIIIYEEMIGNFYS